MSNLLVITLTQEQSVAVASGLIMLRMSCEAALEEAKETRAKEVIAYLEERLTEIVSASTELRKAKVISTAPAGSEIVN